MAIQTQYRTAAVEIMDDFSLEGEELREALDKIATINQLLGGNKLTLQGIEKLLKEVDRTKTITIVDVGCGNGDMLRLIADYGKEKNRSFQLIGVDANAFTIEHARELSKKYANISYRCEDVFSIAFEEVNYDILLCTLTLHHFNNKEIENILNVFQKQSTIGIVINDLHRSSIAYRLFQWVCWVFQLNRMSREDGLTSILRGFKKKELEDFSKKIQAKKQTITWKWAFRYQWIIWK